MIKQIKRKLAQRKLAQYKVALAQAHTLRIHNPGCRLCEAAVEALSNTVRHYESI